VSEKLHTAIRSGDRAAVRDIVARDGVAPGDPVFAAYLRTLIVPPRRGKKDPAKKARDLEKAKLRSAFLYSRTCGLDKRAAFYRALESAPHIDINNEKVIDALWRYVAEGKSGHVNALAKKLSP
jgi:hypothetical protein